MKFRIVGKDDRSNDDREIVVNEVDEQGALESAKRYGVIPSSLYTISENGQDAAANEVTPPGGNGPTEHLAVWSLTPEEKMTLCGVGIVAMLGIIAFIAFASPSRSSSPHYENITPAASRPQYPASVEAQIQDRVNEARSFFREQRSRYIRNGWDTSSVDAALEAVDEFEQTPNTDTLEAVQSATTAFQGETVERINLRLSNDLDEYYEEEDRTDW